MDSTSYLKAVEEVLDELLDGRTQVKAAALGSTLKSRDLDWSRYGYPRLKDVLAALAATSDVEAGPDEKDALSVWRGAAPSLVGHPATSLPSSWTRRSLKKPIWNAFVSEELSGPRRIDRKTGVAWLSTHQPPLESAEWVAVEPIESDIQRAWARSFLADRELSSDTELDSAISADDWYRKLPAALERRNSDIRKEWNRERSRLVGEHVLKWCGTEHVDPSVLFESRVRQPTAAVTGSLSGANSLRGALLEAISRMSTDALLELRLPARTLIETLRPDLLS